MLTVCLLGLAAPVAASAATLHVTSGADSGAGSLRDVIAAAGDGDTVVIDPGVNPTLTSRGIQIGPSVNAAYRGHSAASGLPGNLTIVGQGARVTTITGTAQGGSTFFIAVGSGTVSMSGLTLTGGAAGVGGAIAVSTGSLALTDVTLTNNNSSSAGAGGAIYFSGSTMTLDRVIVTGNSATNCNSGGCGSGGGVYFGGAAATISDSTIVNNLGDGGGGGLEVAGPTTLINDTISGNNGRGVGDNIWSPFGAAVTLQNTIVANSSTASSCAGTGFTSSGHNLEDTTPSQCGLSAAQGDLIGVKPLLSPLANNGGPTDTMALGTGSPAIDAVPAANCPIALDQRGLPRPDSSESSCDIAAYELQDSTPVSLACTPPSIATGLSATCTATVANPASALAGPPRGVVSFTSNGSGSFSGAGSCTLAGSGGVSSCAVSYTSTAVGSGQHVLTATYGGDSTYPRGSATTTEAVTPRPTAVAAGCSPSAVDVGQTTTCTATVTDRLGAGAGTPTGVVSFTATGSGSFSGAGSCTLAGSGGASSCAVSYTPTAVGSGQHVLTATYGGDSTYPSASATTTEAVTPRPTAVAAGCSPSSVDVGQTTTCTATVTDRLGAGAGTPTGVVTFSANGSGGFGGNGACLLAGTGAAAACSVSFTPSAVGSGTDTITAGYAGDGARQGAGGSTDLTVAHLVKAATSVAVTCSPGTVEIGKSTSCKATISPVGNGAAGSPTGSVSFTSSGAGGIRGGGSCTLVAASCSVTYTLEASASGTYTVTAVYGGDANYAGASAMTSLAAAPVAGVTANVTVISGTVLIKLPSSSSFVPLVVRSPLVWGQGIVPIKGATVSVPVGSTIDAHRTDSAGNKGRLILSTAADYRPATDPRHTVQTGTFAVAIFTIEQESARRAAQRLHRQRSRLRGIPSTNLRLRTPAGAVPKARCHRHGFPGKGVVRQFSGSAKGLFRTIGASSITTVRSAVWIVEDRCDGTLTEVGRGRAIVTSRGRRRQHSQAVGPGQGVLIKGRFL